MKKILPVILILLTISFASPIVSAQEKPLSQAEYVRMLYALGKNPAAKQLLAETIRKRGIGFELTDGLRGLTRSKSANDEELKRALEEAERRRQNPVAAKLPSEKEATEILEKTRQNSLTAVEEMPDFVVKQLINRSIAYAGTNNWKQIDNLAIAVSYSEKDGEQYKVLAVNGALVNAERGSNYAGLSGSTTRGEFVEDLKRVFKADSKTEFAPFATDVLRGRDSIIYEYRIALENNKGVGLTFKGAVYSSVPAGEKGKIWIDKESFRVLRIQTEFTDIPTNFPLRAFENAIDYDWVEISGQKYLLPILSNAKFTSLSDSVLLQTRNLIRFRNYQKFGTDVIILNDDTEPIQEEKP